jgi:serine/threonine-protein kinase
LIGWGFAIVLQRLLFGLAGGAGGTLLTGLAVGLILGVVQWATLMQRTHRIGVEWLLATMVAWTAGWLVGWPIAWRFFGGLGFGPAFAGIGAIVGFMVGAAQWLILRRLVYRAGWWILVTCVAWSIALAVSYTYGGLAGGFLTGILAAAITGGVLVWLFLKPRPG